MQLSITLDTHNSGSQCTCWGHYIPGMHHVEEAGEAELSHRAPLEKYHHYGYECASTHNHTLQLLFRVHEMKSTWMLIAAAAVLVSTLVGWFCLRAQSWMANLPQFMQQICSGCPPSGTWDVSITTFIQPLYSITTIIQVVWLTPSSILKHLIKLPLHFETCVSKTVNFYGLIIGKFVHSLFLHMDFHLWYLDLLIIVCCLLQCSNWHIM